MTEARGLNKAVFDRMVGSETVALLKETFDDLIHLIFRNQTID